MSGPLPGVHDYKCGDCKRPYAMRHYHSAVNRAPQLVHGDERVDWELEKCPHCGSYNTYKTLSRNVGIGTPDRGIKYPYFDRGLGRELISSEHRQAVMTELGVIEAPGFNGNGGNRELAELNRARADMNQHLEDIEVRPEFAEYRRLRDRGYEDDVKASMRSEFEDSQSRKRDAAHNLYDEAVRLIESKAPSESIREVVDAAESL